MNKQSFSYIIGGILFLIIAMGISRFAYTPILPLMKDAIGFSASTAGYLASSNYIGYLAGALLAGIIRGNKKHILLWSIIINIFSILFMGMTDNLVIWFILRFLAGISSGFIFVLTSSIMLDYLASKKLAHWSGLIYSGVGIGIVISGLSVPLLHTFFAWKGTWIGLGLLTILLGAIAIFLWKSLQPIKHSERIVDNQGTLNRYLPWLIIAYGLQGFGYIVTATFIVEIVHSIPSLQSFSSYTWVLVGIAAIPSTFLWISIMNKHNAVYTLCFAFVLQIIGVVLPVFSQSILSIFVAAILFGLTFMGITTMSTAYARQLSPTNSHKVIGIITSVYAFFQMIGPTIGGSLASYTGNFKLALLLAGGLEVMSIIILLTGKWYTSRQKQAALITKT
ncbi:YbfB/YjiJ family MFS transporter [Bacillus massiliigorillae]|uniref:YbfB/YjiJ family MFS transporter n=1 Tax=Bacillus massiliigorillae TaxID=1243664 RepID=UPI00039D4BCC|nr:YbfB/YjiJ family MFS transporter [Bacillus massiliigorillae]